MSEEKPFNYKSAIDELEKIVTDIESGRPDVDELSGMVERSAYLIKKCREKLKNTENHLNDTLEG